MDDDHRRTPWWATAMVGIAAAAVGFFVGMKASEQQTVVDPAAKGLHTRINPSTCKRATDGEPACAVCMDYRQDCVLGPCNHVVCQRCAVEVQQCPMCRVNIASRERLFIS
uniref:RING-type domain-containing protein n=1 Tax=Neobodo designis TaxID=312471 RepID=A0A7S1Q6B5_NEODS|mmetsp:Transcript_32499/g.100563  ORF Transcript_32499/g.100563 Transcript_32499/m.100563 type:complete len:111 (+) Transcript_32499:29-361(+)